MTAPQAMTDTEMLTAIENRGLCVGWESSDDPFARHHIATRCNTDGDTTRSKLSVKFRGPVKDALAACIIAEREGLSFGADVWSPDFLESRGLPHRGYPSNNPVDYAKTHPARTRAELNDLGRSHVPSMAPELPHAPAPARQPGDTQRGSTL